MKRSFVALLGLFLVAGSATALVAQAPTRPAGPPPSGNGEVRGTVMDGNTIAEPIEYWEVRAESGESVVITGRRMQISEMFMSGLGLAAPD